MSATERERGGMALSELLSWLAFIPSRIAASLNPFMLYNRRRLLLTAPERQAMREAGRFNAQLMDEVRALIAPGVTTGQIDKLVVTYTRDHGHGWRGLLIQADGERC